MNELPKAYNPKDVEEKIYQKWMDSNCFNPDALKDETDKDRFVEPYAVMMPPPNVTGVLHLGHALENSIMDIMARYQRMCGKKVLLLPGTDHAAVATQAKVEKILVEKGIKNPRQELGREKLLEEIKKFAENSKATILSQIKKMGTSCDWSRLAYTFDDQRNLAVNEVFKRMYEDGLIYRGHRVINWSVKGQSTCSDDELVHIERIGKLYTFKYSKDFPITIATTRPETKLGDTAVAVNPSDERYQQYIGQTFIVEVGARKPLEIKIIANENIDPEFGTGAVGVTPAHSSTDFEIYLAQKAKNEPIGFIQIIDKNGKMTFDSGDAYDGLIVEKAREKFVQYLKDNNLLEKEEEIAQNVGTSDRFGDVVEAIPMTQWFVDVNKEIPSKRKSLKNLMTEAISVGHNGDHTQKVIITPKRFEKIYFNWIDNLRDWCISRQVWWGHRIPVWYCECGEMIVSGKMPSKCPSCEESFEFTQDPDTLDTWFSSGLWTFSTLGWPRKTEDLKTFHPTSWMQMGHEILFFWMARMILMSTYAIDQIPFRDVYIHGILRDEKGKKFSKSAGNTLDPIEMTDKYGTDALRLGLISGIAPGNDSKFYEEKIESSRNFVNKLWNINRYITQKFQKPSGITKEDIKKENLTLSDIWISKKMSILIEEVSNDLNKFRFSQAAEKLQYFTWNDFADWYIEISKFEQNSTEKSLLLFSIIEDLLKMWHPFIPFVTEEIFGNETGNLLATSKWPHKEYYWNISLSSGKNSMSFESITQIIETIRIARAENNVEPGKKIDLVIDIKSFIESNPALQNECENMLSIQSNIIKGLRTGVEKITIKNDGVNIENSISKVTENGISLYIPLAGLIDIEKEKIEKQKESENIKEYIKNIERKLSNDQFTSKAPKEIVEKERESLSNASARLKELENYLQSIQ